MQRDPLQKVGMNSSTCFACHEMTLKPHSLVEIGHFRICCGNSTYRYHILLFSVLAQLILDGDGGLRIISKYLAQNEYLLLAETLAHLVMSD